MSRRIIGSTIGALAAASLAAPAAYAGTPAKVSVRVESLTRTLVSTTVTTTRAAVANDGTHTCTGTSAAGALQLATQGKWQGSWFDGLGYALDSVDGVKPAGFDYWALWIDGKAASVGLCDAELQAGDSVLEFICHDATAPDYACKNRPLALIAPKRPVKAGQPVTIAVVTLKDDGSTLPAAGATVHGGVKDVKADAAGKARVVLAAGQSALQATRAGDVPSATLSCAIGAHGGHCGSSDRTPPALTVNGIAAGQVFATAKAPRLLRGVATDPSGVAVALRLTRRTAKGCTSFDANRGAFRPCGAHPRALFPVGDRSRWSYLLPAKLGTGSYVLDVSATDTAGNRTSKRIRFQVV